MSPQIQIWKREHDGQWVVCMWVPTVIQLNGPTFNREREVFPDLGLALQYLQRRWGLTENRISQPPSQNDSIHSAQSGEEREQ